MKKIWFALNQSIGLKKMSNCTKIKSIIIINDRLWMLQILYNIDLYKLILNF